MATVPFAEFRRNAEDGVRAGLVAAALQYQAQLRPKLQRGYTSGNFTQGIQAAAVQVSDVERRGDRWRVVVGTNEMISLYWEMGHQNLFTRRYERVEYWRETMVEETPAMHALFVAEIASATGGSST